MAINSQAYTVTDAAAVALTPTDSDRTRGVRVLLYLEAHGSSHKVALGGAGVTIANGVHLYGAEKLGPLELQPGEVLYAISDSATGLDLRALWLGN